MNDLVPPPANSGKPLMVRLEDALLPLINLVFLLLMFFIVAGQLSETPLPDLPGSGAQAGNNELRADLTVAANGELKVEGGRVSAQALPKRLPAPDAESPLKIAAAHDVSVAELESLLNLLEASGYREVILLTEPAG